MLRYENILLRPVEEIDIPLFYDWLNREESMGDFSDFCIVPKDDIEKSYHEGKYWSDDRKYLIIVIDDKPVGEAVIHKALNYPSAGLEIAICIDEMGYRNSGYATQTIRLLLNYIFENQPDVNRVQAIMDTKNILSIKLFEKCHFTKEGVLRGMFYHHGSFRDSYIYSIIRSEWNKHYTKN